MQNSKTFYQEHGRTLLDDEFEGRRLNILCSSLIKEKKKMKKIIKV